MATPLDAANLCAVFKRILQSHQLQPQEMKKDRSHIAVSDKGHFHCDNCAHSWRSNFSWITFDLREMQIIYRWRMKCQHCYLPWIPTFTVPQLEAMFEKAVRCYKGDMDPPKVNIGYSGRRIFRQPHRPDLCEKCSWGLDQCWTRKFYTY